MKEVFVIMLILAIVSCQSANQEAQQNSISDSVVYISPEQNFPKRDSLNFDFIQSKIKEYESRLNQTSCSYAIIKKQAKSNKSLGIASIPVLEQIIKHCISSLNQKEKDSTYLLFVEMYYMAVNSINDSAYSTYKMLFDKLDKEVLDEETKNFKKCLHICGTEILMTEGSSYLDAEPDYFYSIFKGKISEALDEYLKIRKEEIKQGFSEDAGLLITYDDLYKRVMTWEKFRAKYPDFFLKEYSEYYYNTYLSTLITGMDNSPVFDYESGVLLPEIKKLYEKIINKKSSEKSSQVISAYYELLKTKEFKKPDDTQKFLEENGLFSMHGVQPDNR